MKTHSSKADGFSLIEVTISLGLVTFVLVALLGLFSVGMQATQGSVSATSLAKIIAQASQLKERLEEGGGDDGDDRLVLLKPGDEPIVIYYNGDGSLYTPGEGVETEDYTHAYTVTISAVAPGNVGPPSSHFSLLRLHVEWRGGETTMFSSVVY